jgi:hypothetical protein
MRVLKTITYEWWGLGEIGNTYKSLLVAAADDEILGEMLRGVSAGELHVTVNGQTFHGAWETSDFEER